MNEAMRLRGHTDMVKEIIFMPEALLSLDRSGGDNIMEYEEWEADKTVPKTDSQLCLCKLK